MNDYYSRHEIDVKQLHKAYLAGTKLKEIAYEMDTTQNAIAHKISDERRRNPSAWPLRKFSGHTRTATDRLEMYREEILLTLHVLEDLTSISAGILRDHWKAIADRHGWLEVKKPEIEVIKVKETVKVDEFEAFLNDQCDGF